MFGLIWQAISGRVFIYGALAALVAGFAGGWYVKGKFEDAAKLAAVNEARIAERDAAQIGIDADRRYLANLQRQKEKSDANLKRLQNRLARARSCVVPVSPGLRDGTDIAATTPVAGRAEPAAAPMDPATEPVADARDVVLTCERNRLEVAEPNAEQIIELQQWYEQLRKRYNKGAN